VRDSGGSGVEPGRDGLLGARRRLAWVGFLLLAGNAPVMAWFSRDDSWLFPLAVAAMVGYAIIVDDHLRRRAARPDLTEPTTRGVDRPGSSASDVPVEDTPDRTYGPFDGPSA
jgi:hypothetical protein